MNPLNWFRPNKTTDESIEDSRQITKILRFVQIALLLLVIIYVAYTLFFSDNFTKLPLLPEIPSAWIVFGSFAMGWAIAWIPARIRRWRMQRDNNRLSKRVEDLEKSLGINQRKGKRTLFPDRDPEISRQQQHTYDDADNILAQEAQAVASHVEEVAESEEAEEAKEHVSASPATSQGDDVTTSPQEKA